MPRLLTLYLVQPSIAPPPINLRMAAESSAKIKLDTNLLAIERELRQQGQPFEVALLIQHDDHGLHHADIDNDGRPLVYVSTHQMAAILDEQPLLSEWDQSVMMFLRFLDPTIKVIPWWH